MDIENSEVASKALFHLPGLFEFYELYNRFLPLFYDHRDWFYEWCEIGSIYGSPADCLWGGGRVEAGEAKISDVIKLVTSFGISPRLTFSNSLLEEKNLSDRDCNRLCEQFSGLNNTGIIIYSDLLLNYLKEKYPSFYYVSTTTKVITDFAEFVKELNREDYAYVVPDFRLNHQHEKLCKLTTEQKKKTEFLLNECCSFSCTDRKACYEAVSRRNLGDSFCEFACRSNVSGKGYSFYDAMNNPGFIGVSDIIDFYLPNGFSNFKIEGRGLGSAVVFEMLLYYLVRPEYQLKVREEVYLDNMLDLF